MTTRNLIAKFQFIAGLALSLVLFTATPSLAADTSAVPATLLWEGEHLVKVRAEDFADDAVIEAALRRLRVRADTALGRGPYSVVDRGDLPPSGDPHDYVSYGTYWWPNPDTADGLPFVRRDGVANQKQIANGDHDELKAMSQDVTDLALAGYLFGEPKYSRHAALLLRTWFLDSATRMNPHLRHGQMVPGINTGRCFGIIDTYVFPVCIDAALVLEQSDEWSDEDQRRMRAWFQDYRKWLLEDPMGRQEGATKNNHATAYDVQVVTMSLFLGDTEMARQVLEQVPSRRLARQIEPDGRQPEEIARTRGLSYSAMNLRGLCLLARLGEHCEVDLWKRENVDNRLLLAAEFLYPYLVEPTDWPFQQIGNKRPGSVADYGYLLATRLGKDKFSEVMEPPARNDISPLVYSRVPRD
jgi:hypothetical protein